MPGAWEPPVTDGGNTQLELTQRAGEAGRFTLFSALEDTVRYAGLLLAPEEGFGLRPRLHFIKKKIKQF